MARFVVAAFMLVMTFSSCLCVYLDAEWTSFKQTYNKQYRPEDELKRRAIWENNNQFITKHNLEADRGVHTFWLGMNQFGDLTKDEFSAAIKGLNSKELDGSPCKPYVSDDVTSSRDLPDAVDWRKKGAVTPIINQGQCGSSWAFSATVSMEGLHQIKTGKLVSLSASNLLDCSRAEGNDGCCGGLMDYAFKYVMKNKGIDTTAAYPYQPKDNPCNFTRAGVGATIKGCMDIPLKDEASMKKAIAMEGPVATAVFAQLQSYMYYKSGVYSDKDCVDKQPDHGIPVVGYGTLEGKDYWILKNSWDVTWGMKGYMLLARNAGNMCGIATQASFPTA